MPRPSTPTAKYGSTAAGNSVRMSQRIAIEQAARGIQLDAASFEVHAHHDRRAERHEHLARGRGDDQEASAGTVLQRRHLAESRAPPGHAPAADQLVLVIVAVGEPGTLLGGKKH